MRKEVILVKKGECPLNVIASMGEQVKNAWIFIHYKTIPHLEETADFVSGDRNCEKMTWRKTRSYPKTVLFTKPDIASDWIKVMEIQAEDIAFKKAPFDPENIFFLKMEE